MNIDKANNIAYIEGKAYYIVPVESGKVFICEIDGKKYYLGPEANRRMSWYDAKVWAKDVGGVLMPREVAIIAFKKEEVCKHFRTGSVYWLNEEPAPGFAWYQIFNNGYQDYSTTGNVYYARAVFVE